MRAMAVMSASRKIIVSGQNNTHAYAKILFQREASYAVCIAFGRGNANFCHIRRKHR